MGVDRGIAHQEDKMQSLVLAAVLSLAAARPQLPAGLSAAECPNYPFCGASSPANFPVPVVNGAPVAPILNTTPSSRLSTGSKPRLHRALLPSLSQLSTERMLLPVTTRCPPRLLPTRTIC